MKPAREGLPVQGWVRLALLGSALAIVQLCMASQISILGSRPDLMPLVAVAAGLLCGAIPGAVIGFSLGLFIDTAQLLPLGVSSLVYLIVGYLAGRYHDIRDPANALVPLLIGTLATAGATIGYAVEQFLLGNEVSVSGAVLQDIVVVTAMGAALAMPVHSLIQRVMLPVLPQDPRRRRRRASTTSLSPLHRAS